MLLAIVAGLIFVVQGVFSREFSRRFQNGLYQLLSVNAIALIIGSAVLFVLLRPSMISASAMAFAAAFGALFVITMSIVMMAFSRGPMGISKLIIDMSIIITLIFGILVFDEKPTVIGGIAMVIVIAALILIALPDHKESEKAQRSWFFLAIAAMVLNGTLSVVQKSAFTVCTELESADFTFWSITLGAVISSVMFLIMKFVGKKHFAPEDPVKQLPILAAGLGLGTALAYWFQNRALEVEQSIIVFPVVACINVGLLMIISIIFFGEKLTLRRGIAFVAGLAGIVMMNM